MLWRHAKYIHVFFFWEKTGINQATKSLYVADGSAFLYFYLNDLKLLVWSGSFSILACHQEPPNTEALLFAAT